MLATCIAVSTLLAQANSNNWSAQLDDFVSAVESKNLGLVSRYFDPAVFDPIEAERFLKGRSRLPPTLKFRPLLDFVNAQSVQFIQARRTKHSFVIRVYFVLPQMVSDSMLVSQDIYRKKLRWMQDFAACEFVVKGGEMLLRNNFCFNETDGP